MSIWQFFGSKFTFSEYISKITASIKTLLPAALPATVQAATFTHGDVSLHIDYFEIFSVCN